MALRKIYIAINCQDDAQKERVQKIAEELSGIYQIDGAMLEAVYPQLQKKRNEIYWIIQHIKENGVKGIKSMKFISLLSSLFV